MALQDWNEIHTPVDAAIRRINTDELYRLRRVRGRDLNQWHQDLTVWIQGGLPEEALALLGEIITVAETLQQYDSREPQPYWYEKAAKILADQGEHGAAELLLRNWLHLWPETREQSAHRRKRIEARADRYAALAAKRND